MKKINFAIPIMIICLLCLNVQAAESKRYVVAPDSKSTEWQGAEWKSYPDSPDCTPVTPETAMKNAVAGDIVYFRGGTYNIEAYPDDQRVRLHPANDGTEADPIEFRNYPEEIPNLHDVSDDIINGGMIGAQGNSWIIYNGFKTTDDDGTARMAAVEGSNNIIFKNCMIIGTPLDYIGPGNYDGFRFEGSDNILVKNSYAENLKDDVEHGCAIKLYNVDNATIEHSSFYNNDVGVISKEGSRNCKVRYNYFRKIEVASVSWLDITGKDLPINDLNVYQNIVDRNTYTDGNYIGGGMRINSDDVDVDTVNIYNNVFYGELGSTYGSFLSKNASDISYWNNICVGVNDTAHLLQTLDSNTTNFRYIDHNLYASFTSVALHRYKDNAVTYNTFSDWLSGEDSSLTGNQDSNSINGKDPLFANPNATKVENRDFTLQPDSPARNAGIDRQDHDNDGNSTESINMGAYITGNERIGYSPKLLPPQALEMK